MLKGKQTIMRLETYGKEAYSNKHLKVKQDKQRIRVFWGTASRTLEQICVRMSSASYERSQQKSVPQKRDLGSF